MSLDKNTTDYEAIKSMEAHNSLREKMLDKRNSNQERNETSNAYDDGMHIYKSERPLYALGFKNTEEVGE